MISEYESGMSRGTTGKHAYLSTINHWRARFQGVGVPASVIDSIVDALSEWREWPILWEKEGDREASYAEEENKRGHFVTAMESWRRSCLYYHFGQFILFDDETLRNRLSQKKEEAFGRALPLLSPPGEKLRVAVPGGFAWAVLRKPVPSEETALVIILPGADSSKEEYSNFEDLFLRRGLATLTVDGPGQGEARRNGLPWRFDYEEVFPPIIELLANLDGIDQGRLGLVGFSFGGYLSPRVAARCPQIGAAVSLGGCFDLAYWEALPPLLKEDLAYLFGAEDEQTAGKLAIEEVSLDGIVGKVAGDLLVVHGTEDRIFKHQDAWRMKDAKPDAEVVVYEGGDHCCHNRSHRAKPLIADWLSDALQ